MRAYKIYLKNVGLNIADEIEFRKAVTERTYRHNQMHMKKFVKRIWGKFIRVWKKSEKWRLAQIVVQCMSHYKNNKLEELIMNIKQVLDAKGLACPMPIVRTKRAMDALDTGEVLEIHVTDKGVS